MNLLSTNLSPPNSWFLPVWAIRTPDFQVGRGESSDPLSPASTTIPHRLEVAVVLILPTLLLP